MLSSRAPITRLRGWRPFLYVWRLLLLTGRTRIKPLDLIAKGMLGIDGEKVVRFSMDHVAQAAVVSHALLEGHDGETVAELIEKLTPDGDDGSIERAVRALEWTGLAVIGEGGKVTLGW